MKVVSKMAVGTRMFSRMNYQVIRGMKELYTIQELSAADWVTIKDYFDHRCAYCDKLDSGNPRDGIVPDHLIPASENGDFVIGNVIAACHDCNDRRGKKQWDRWLETQFPEFAGKRIQKIHQYLRQFAYVVIDKPESRLIDEELQEYYSIMSEWELLWQRARKLRNNINKRVKQGKG